MEGRNEDRDHWCRQCRIGALAGNRNSRKRARRSFRQDPHRFTNPLGVGPDGLELVLGHDTSGGEQVAVWAPGAAVFKTLNQTGAENMDKAALFPIRPVMFVAGDDQSRKPIVLSLIAKLGFEAVDAGPLRIARLLEAYGMLWIDQALNRRRGQSFAFALTDRSPR
jgi:hypothetical protein